MDDDAFEAAYPVTKGHKPLYDAIQHARRLRGDLIQRKSKNGTPRSRARQSADGA